MFDIHDFYRTPYYFSGSSQSTVSGLPVFYTTKPQERVQVFPKIIKVAVPSPQHSPILGQLLMRKSYSNYIYQLSYEAQCFPIGNFTFNHFGFATGKVFSKTASINQFFRLKVRMLI
jgi:hypothetical protein